MGVLDSLFGTGNSTNGTADETAEQKYAILLNAGPDDAPVASNGFNYALEFDDAGYDVQVFLDGEATKWPATFAENPDLPFQTEWREIRDRDLLAGACGYCANAFEVVAAYEDTDIAMLSDATEHAPEVADLAGDGYEMLTVG